MKFGALEVLLCALAYTQRAAYSTKLALDLD